MNNQERLAVAICIASLFLAWVVTVEIYAWVKADITEHVIQEIRKGG